jgi:hypothetical protein
VKNQIHGSNRHPSEGWGPALVSAARGIQSGMPAFAGMTEKYELFFERVYNG